MIAAAPAPGVATAGSAGNPNEVVDRPYPTSYYPGTPDVSVASAVDIQPRADLTGLDILVPEQQLFRVRGRVLDPSGARQPDTASSQSSNADRPRGQSVFPDRPPLPRGRRDVRDSRRRPGAYWLRAMVNDGSADSLLPRSAAGRPVTEVLIDSLFSNRRAAQVPLGMYGDLDGVALTLGSACRWVAER